MDGSGPADARRPGISAAWILTVVVLAALLGVKSWRAGFESSLWMDEVWSLGLVTQPWSDLVEHARLDVNPPLYYIALYAWLQLLGAGGIPLSVTAARSLNLVLWIVLAVGVSSIGKRLVGGLRAWIFPLLVAGSAFGVQFTQDARPYGLALLGSATCFLLAALDLERRRRGTAFPSWGLWLGYSLSAFTAFGSHVLCLPMVGLIAVAWLAVGSRRRLLPKGRAWIPPVASHLLALGAALPWLLVGWASGRELEAGDPGWLTPATFSNLGRVFAEWLPLGRAGAEVGLLTPLMRGLGFLCLLSVAAIPILLRPGARRLRPGRQDDLSFDLFVAGVLAAAVHVFLIWSTQRLGWFHVFYGPRYACLSVGVWTGATALGVAAVGKRRGSLAALLLAAPWVVAGLLSTILAARGEIGAGLEGQRSRILARSSATPVYFAPERLAPFFRKTLDRLGAEPSRRLPCALLESDHAALLQLNAWPQNDPTEEIRFRSAVAQGRIIRVEQEPLPPATHDFEVWLLTRDGSDRSLLEDWCERGIAVRHPRDAEATAAVALLEDQRRSDGWSYLEFDRDLNPYRWTAAAAARLRFDRSLAPGRSRLRLQGYSAPGSGLAERLEIATPDGSWSTAVEIGPGSFVREIDLALDRRSGDRLELVLRHPLRRPQASADGGDRRSLGIAIQRAVVVVPPDPAPESDPGSR